MEGQILRCSSRHTCLEPNRLKIDLVHGTTHSRLQKNSVLARTSLRSSMPHSCHKNLRMLKKAVRQGRSARRAEAYASVR